MKARRNAIHMVAEYTSLAMLLPGCVVVGYGIGWLLDRWLGTGFLTPVFLVVGIAAGFVELLRKLLRDARREDDAGRGR